MLRQLLRPVVRNVGQRVGTRAAHDVKPYKYPTMDELPLPQGSWQAHYDERQKKYNLILALGLAYAIGTMSFVISTGSIYLNWAPPVPKDQK